MKDKNFSQYAKMYLVQFHVQVARPITTRKKAIFSENLINKFCNIKYFKNIVFEPYSTCWQAAMLNITLSGSCENWQSSSIHTDIVDIFRSTFIFRYPYLHQYKRVIVIVYWSEYPNEII